jgi:ubiquinone biosynthesis protein
MNEQIIRPSAEAEARSSLNVQAHERFQDMRRFAEVLRSAVKHGWRHYVHRVPVLARMLREMGFEEPTRLTATARVRVMFEELGPVFVKLGQMLSVRQDLFAPDIIAELEKLQHSVSPFPAAQARDIIRAELGQPVESLFARFDDEPFAAASMAQVHRAALHDGTEVIAKVQRPGIRETIEADLAIMFFIARLLAEHVEESRRFDPLALVEEFADTIRKELDFSLEGRNAMRFRENFRNEPAVKVPEVFWPLTAGRVLCMEFSTGQRVSAEFPADLAERQRLAALLARLFLQQLFEHGLFHGDPHSGNVSVMADGRFCFHDFGIVGRLSRRDRLSLGQLFLAVTMRDAEWMADVYVDMGVAAESVDRSAFGRALERSLEQYYAVSEGGFSFAEILNQFITLGRHHEIRMPREFLMVAKAFMAVESQACRLDKGFNVVEAFQSYLPRMVDMTLLAGVRGADARALAYRAWSEGHKLAAGLADAANGVLRQLKSGRPLVRVRHEQIEDLERHFDRASNRLSFSFVISAIVIASSIILSSNAGPYLDALPQLGLLGYGLAAVLGLWWAIAILRSGKL